MVSYSKRMDYMNGTAEVVRNLFNGMTNPDIISFTGGAPANENLPIEYMREIAQDVFTREKRGVEAFQYGNPMGIREFRDIIARHILPKKEIHADPDGILILTGGMEGIDLVSAVFIDPGDVILVESPTFVQSLETFQMYGARCVSVDMDEHGLDMEDLERKIRTCHPKLIYTIPTFQNPSGRTLPKDRRRAVAALAEKYDVLVLEDDPYQDLRYSGEPQLPIKSYDKTDHVIFNMSFSKNFAPGARLGYVLASKDIIRRVFDAKTATNSHTSTVNQVLCMEYIRRGYFDAHLSKMCAIYKERRDIMLDCVHTFLPEGTRCVPADGGIFCWVELPERFDTRLLLTDAAKAGVAFLPGVGFFAEADGTGKNCMRCGFGNIPPEKIRTGMERLGRLLARQ